MLISIVTINYNNSEGLAKTIESVVSQTYDDIEYIVIDGGSTDGSVDFIKKYEGGISYWTSERDSGIYNAMNKGIVKATGEYLLFLNSGDTLKDNNVVSDFWQNVIERADIVYGDLIFDSKEQQVLYVHPDKFSFNYFYKGNTISHPASFIKREMFLKYGLYNEENRIVSDWEFFVKAVCLQGCSYVHIPKIVSIFQTDGISSDSKNKLLMENERELVLRKYFNAFILDYERLSKLDDIFIYSKVIKVFKKLIGNKWDVVFAETGTTRLID